MILPTGAHGTPRRGLPSTVGRSSVARAARRFSPSGERQSGAMSSIFPLRSRNAPLESMRPGFSAPASP